MSTRCSIHFTYPDSTEVQANVYRHSDGYPDGVLPDLEQFFADVEAQTKDTRFSDPTYLAAKFVVWQAGKMAEIGARYRFEGGNDVRPLDFLSVGVQITDPGDIEYVYTVECGGSGRPKVTYREV